MVFVTCHVRPVRGTLSVSVAKNNNSMLLWSTMNFEAHNAYTVTVQKQKQAAAHRHRSRNGPRFLSPSTLQTTSPNRLQSQISIH